MRRFRIEEVILYSDEYTLKRWPNSRGPEISLMKPGGVIGYKFHRTVLTFIKTRGAENIMLSSLTPVNSFGEASLDKVGSVLPGAIAQTIGLQHGMHARFEALDFRGERAFLLTTRVRKLTEEELRRIEEELLKDDE